MKSNKLAWGLSALILIAALFVFLKGAFYGAVVPQAQADYGYQYQYQYEYQYQSPYDYQYQYQYQDPYQTPQI